MASAGEWGRTVVAGERGRTWLVAMAVLAAVAWFQAPFLLDRSIVVERDALSSILPIRAFLARALHEGSWPMWNPAPSLGKPYLAEWQTGLFYPPSALLLVPPFSRGFNLLFVFHYAWTAIGAVLLLRALGASGAAAALGALVWALGGPLVSLGHLLNHLMTISWLPWVLWAWVRTMDPVLRVASASLLLAAALLTGSPEMALLIAGFLVLLAGDARALWVPALAALIAAAQLVPVLHYLGETHRGAHGLSREGVLAWSTSLGRLPDLLRAAAPDPDAFLPTIYVGPLPVVLALVGLALASPRARRVAGLAALGLLALALGSNAAVLPWLHDHFPGVDLLRYPEKLLLGVHALVALGAAFGLTRLSERLSPRWGAVAAAALAVGVAADLTRVNRDVLLSWPPERLLDPPAIARTIAAPAETGETVRRYYSNGTGAPRPASVGQAVEIDRDLLWAATGELYGLANVNTPGSLNLVAHERLHRALESRPRAGAVAILGALGTRWVTSFADLGEGDVPLREVDLSSAGARLYEIENAAPRAWVAERVVAAPDAAAALERFTTAARPGGLAVVEGIGAADIARRASDRASVSWVEEGIDRLVLDVDVGEPALVVVNDTFLEGWRASVDGAPATLERVNGIVRGVWVGTGRHRVTMRYRAPGLPLGGALSLVALVGIGLALVPRRLRRAQCP